MDAMPAMDQEKLGNLLASAKQIAKEYLALTGKPLGITGEVVSDGTSLHSCLG